MLENKKTPSLTALLILSSLSVANAYFHMQSATMDFTCNPIKTKLISLNTGCRCWRQDWCLTAECWCAKYP